MIGELGGAAAGGAFGDLGGGMGIRSDPSLTNMPLPPPQVPQLAQAPALPALPPIQNFRQITPATMPVPNSTAPTGYQAYSNFIVPPLSTAKSADELSFSNDILGRMGKQYKGFSGF